MYIVSIVLMHWRLDKGDKRPMGHSDGQHGLSEKPLASILATVSTRVFHSCLCSFPIPWKPRKQQSKTHK